MLCGIGGRTIEEAQHRLSYDEFLSWVAYRRKRGSLNIGMRVERAAALLATLFANVNSKEGGYKIYDFMPHDEEPELTIDDLKNWK